MNWSGKVIDPDEIKVFLALDSEIGDWRTVWGIARQTRLSEERVLTILKKYDTSLTLFADTPSASGSPLVGLLEKVG